jgi:outer membrane protein
MSIKTSILLFASLVIIANSAFSQKFGFIDSEYILNQIPEYKAANTELDKSSADYQKEIEAKYAEIDKLYKTYQVEQFSLTDDLKEMRQNEIVNKEKDAKDLQNKYFGTDGDLSKKRTELIKPIQDKVDNAIKTVAEKEGLAIVFDKASAVMMLYTNPQYDKSKEVLLSLGITAPKSGNGTGASNANKNGK